MIPERLDIGGQPRYKADPTGSGDCLINGFALIFAEQVRNGTLDAYADTEAYQTLVAKFKEFHPNFPRHGGWPQFKEWLNYYQSPNDVERLLAPVFRKWMATLEDCTAAGEIRPNELNPLVIDNVIPIADKLQFNLGFGQAIDRAGTPGPEENFEMRMDAPGRKTAVFVQTVDPAHADAPPPEAEAHFIVYLDDQSYAARTLKTVQTQDGNKHRATSQDKITFIPNDSFMDYYNRRNPALKVLSPAQHRAQLAAAHGEHEELPAAPVVPAQDETQLQAQAGMQHQEQASIWHVRNIERWWARENGQGSFVITRTNQQVMGFEAKFIHGPKEITLHTTSNEIEFKNVSTNDDVGAAAQQTMKMLFINRGWVNEQGAPLARVPDGQSLAIEPTGNPQQRQIIASIAARHGVNVIGMGGPEAEQQAERGQGQGTPETCADEARAENEGGLGMRPRRLGEV